MPTLRIEGYVIVSADGCLTDAHQRQPDALRFEADHRFLIEALRRAALVVHGRNSGDNDPGSVKRRRIIVTRNVAGISRDPTLANAVLWNPQDAPFADAVALAGVTDGNIAVIGGPQVYALFLDRYDTFWLSQAHRVTLPGGTGCFPGVPDSSPQAVLAAHGLQPGEVQMLDATHDVRVTAWRRGFPHGEEALLRRLEP